LAAGSEDNTAKVWEMPSGNLIATLKHDGWVKSVAFSPDGKLLATGSEDNTAKVWTPNIDDIPSLTVPPDGSEFADALPDLKWDEIPNAAYQIQVSIDRDFTQIVLDISTGDGNRPINSGELAPGNYFWRVRTVGWIDFGVWSETWSFQLGLLSFPPSPTLLSPAEGTDFTTELPTLEWEASPAAMSYTVQVSKDEAFSDIVLEQQIAQNEFSIYSGMLEGGKTYHWRVNAIGASGAGDWSTPWKFSFSPETIPPIPFGLLSPWNGVWTNGTPIFV